VSLLRRRSVDDNFYHLNGKDYERTTRIIGYFLVPELVDWKVRVGNKAANLVMKKSGTFGTLIDAEIRKDWRNPKTSKQTFESQNCFKAWNDFVKEQGVEDVEFPNTLYDEEEKVAGTPDFVWNGGRYLDDIKTTNSVKPSHFIQLGSYANKLPQKPERLGIIRLDKETGIYQYVTNEHLHLSVDECIMMWKSTLYNYRMYHRVQSTLKPKERVYNGNADTE
jgi:hypothetical protein